MGDAAGDERAFPLAAGEGSDLPVGQLGESGAFEGFGYRVTVGLAGSAGKAHVTVASHHHHVDHPHWEGPVHLFGLGDVAQQAVFAGLGGR